MRERREREVGVPETTRTATELERQLTLAVDLCVDVRGQASRKYANCLALSRQCAPASPMKTPQLPQLFVRSSMSATLASTVEVHCVNCARFAELQSGSSVSSSAVVTNAVPTNDIMSLPCSGSLAEPDTEVFTEAQLSMSARAFARYVSRCPALRPWPIVATSAQS